MAGTNDFLPLATGGGANVTDQATYAAQATTSTGYEGGLAKSADANKTWRQATFVAAAVAQLICNKLGLDAPDDGDMATFVSKITRAIAAIAPPAGQCRLVNSGNNVVLLPFQGDRVSFPNGSQVLIAAAGITLTPAALAANTVYNIYLVADGTMEASATGHSTDVNTGIEIKTGDATRVLVGKVRTNAAVHFNVSNGYLGVISWFNRLTVASITGSAVDRTSNTSVIANISTDFDNLVLNWADEAVLISAAGQVTNDTTGEGAVTAVYVDNVNLSFSSVVSVAAPGKVQTWTAPAYRSLVEGAHTFSLFGASTNIGPVAKWNGSSNNLIVSTRG